MNRSRKSRLAAVGCSLLLCVCLANPSSAQTSPCDTCASGVALDVVCTAYNAAYFGRALCQVFAAPDTLLESFTVWRGPDSISDATVMHLFLCEVDSIGRPDPTRIVLDGPRLTLEDTSSVPRPVTWSFSPPFALPHRGYFGAAVKEEDPGCGMVLIFQVDSTASYPCGKLYKVWPKYECLDGLGYGRLLLSGVLRFQVKFTCSDSTPAETATWGQLKARYR